MLLLARAMPKDVVNDNKFPKEVAEVLKWSCLIRSGSSTLLRVLCGPLQKAKNVAESPLQNATSQMVYFWSAKEHFKARDLATCEWLTGATRPARVRNRTRDLLIPLESEAGRCAVLRRQGVVSARGLVCGTAMGPLAERIARS